jgi:hypothetical protein
MLKRGPIGCIIILMLSVNTIFSQVSTSSIQSIKTGSRGYINNPVWSNDGKYLAFEFKPTNSSSKIMVLNVDTGPSAVDLFIQAPPSNGLLVNVDNESMRLPHWSKINANTLYFLDFQDRNFQLSKINNVNITNLPLEAASLIPLHKTINQESNIAEYYPVDIEGEEFLFVKQQNSPSEINYSNQRGHLEIIYELANVIDKAELIDSFTFSLLSPKFLLCKGQDNRKEIIIGKINVDWSGVQSVEFETIDVKKLPLSALQEPSFSPISEDHFAYLELLTDNQGISTYELKVHSLKNKKSYLITDNIYRNEENKTSQPMSTSYAWHTIENIIFFIDKSSNRTISYANISSIEYPVLQSLYTELEFVENICVAPDGRYLAAVTSVNSGQDGEDPLHQIHLIKLKIY